MNCVHAYNTMKIAMKSATTSKACPFEYKKDSVLSHFKVYRRGLEFVFFILILFTSSPDLLIKIPEKFMSSAI